MVGGRIYFRWGFSLSVNLHNQAAQTGNSYEAPNAHFGRKTRFYDENLVFHSEKLGFSKKKQVFHDENTSLFWET